MIVYLQMLHSAPEQDKFRALYEAYSGLMYHVADRLLPDDAEAEDAVHQALVAIIENLDKIARPVDPKTRALVCLITERKALDILRSRSHLSDAAFEESAQGLPVPLPGDGGLADAMSALPAAYREALLLRYQQGYTAREIAHMLGKKTGAVQKLLTRAKAALREELDERGIDHA